MALLRECKHYSRKELVLGRHNYCFGQEVVLESFVAVPQGAY